MKVRCIDCGRDYDVDMEAVKRARRERRRGPSVHWCPECDEARIARVSAGLEEAMARLDGGAKPKPTPAPGRAEG